MVSINILFLNISYIQKSEKYYPYINISLNCWYIQSAGFLGEICRDLETKGRVDEEVGGNKIRFHESWNWKRHEALINPLLTKMLKEL